MRSFGNVCRTAPKMATAALLAFAFLSVAISPASAWAAPQAQAQEDLDRLRALSGREFEIEFMNMMIAHHQSAIEMARLAPDRANHQEVKDVAQAIISAQTTEIDQMTGWLRQWYNASPRTDMPGMGMSDIMNLQGLRGDDFDREFLTAMRIHHTSAIQMAQLVPDRATHSELKTLAQNIISAQQMEIGQFESWLKAWYNIDVMPTESIPGGHAPVGMPRTGSADGPWGSATLLVALAALAAALVAGGLRLRRKA